jgi:hypothetical protein
MRALSPLSRTILICEVITAAWYLYAMSLWYRAGGLHLTFLLPTLSQLVKAGGAIAVAAGVGRGRRWASMGALVLAGLLSISNLVRLGGALPIWANVGLTNAVSWVTVVWLIQAVAQLVALLCALRILKGSIPTSTP